MIRIAIVFVLIILNLGAQGSKPLLRKSVEPEYPVGTIFGETVQFKLISIVYADGTPYAIEMDPDDAGRLRGMPMNLVKALSKYRYETQQKPFGVKITVPYKVPLGGESKITEKPRGTPAVQAESHVVHAAQIRKKWAPNYPPEAKSRGVQGPVLLFGTINKLGQVQDLMVRSGPLLLLEEAYNTVLRWEYDPTTVDGQAVDVVLEITVNFTLN
jgi:TonB family protein